MGSGMTQGSGSQPGSWEASVGNVSTVPSPSVRLFLTRLNYFASAVQAWVVTFLLCDVGLYLASLSFSFIPYSNSKVISFFLLIDWTKT